EEAPFRSNPPFKITSACICAKVGSLVLWKRSGSAGVPPALRPANGGRDARAPAPLLVPLARKEALVTVIEPYRRRPFALLAPRVHGHHPVARRLAPSSVAKGRPLDRLVRYADDLPRRFAQLVDVIAGDPLLRVRCPLQFRRLSLLPAQHILGRRG